MDSEKLTAEAAILKHIGRITPQIKNLDEAAEKRTLTHQEQTMLHEAIGWERGLSWALTVIRMEKEGRLTAFEDIIMGE